MLSDCPSCGRFPGSFGGPGPGQDFRRLLPPALWGPQAPGTTYTGFMTRKLDERQDRGDFFRSLGTLVAGFVAERIEEAVIRRGPKLLRPPGALDELAFLATCTRCDRCLPACPQEAITRAPASAGWSAGTPCIHPRSAPCFLCADLPCIPACPEGALVWPRRGGREGPQAVRMGTAVIVPALCWTYATDDQEGEACRLCVDRCPFPEEAITMTGPQGTDALAHPVVHAERCTGCGLCEFACPVPDPAIVVEPRR